MKEGFRCGYNVILKESAFLDSFGGALISAGTAADADVGIDDELAVALRDSLDGALVGTGTAGNASVGDDVSHSIYLHCSIIICSCSRSPMGISTLILAWISENAIPNFHKVSYKYFLPGLQWLA